MFDYDDGWSYERSCRARDAYQNAEAAYDDWLDMLEEQHKEWEAQVRAGNPGHHHPDRSDFVQEDDNIPF